MRHELKMKEWTKRSMNVTLKPHWCWSAWYRAIFCLQSNGIEQLSLSSYQTTILIGRSTTECLFCCTYLEYLKYTNRIDILCYTNFLFWRGRDWELIELGRKPTGTSLNSLTPPSLLQASILWILNPVYCPSLWRHMSWRDLLPHQVTVEPTFRVGKRDL